MGRKMLEKQNTISHTNMPRSCVVFFLPRQLTRSAILTPINGRPCQLEKENRTILSDTCVDHYILLLKHLSNHAFHNKRFQTLFIDQLVQSKATCSCKNEVATDASICRIRTSDTNTLAIITLTLLGSYKDIRYVLIFTEQWEMKKNLKRFCICSHDDKLSNTTIQCLGG